MTFSWIQPHTGNSHWKWKLLVTLPLWISVSMSAPFKLWSFSKHVPIIVYLMNWAAQKPYALESVSWMSSNSPDELWLTASFKSCRNVCWIKIIQTLTHPYFHSLNIFHQNAFMYLLEMLRHQTAHRHTDVSPIVDWKLKERNHLYKLWELIFIGLSFQTTHSIKLKACCLSQVQLCYVTAWYCKSRLHLWSSAVQKLQWQLMVLWGSALWQKQKLSPVLPSAISSSFFFCLSHKRMPLSILFLFTKKKTIC